MNCSVWVVEVYFYSIIPSAGTIMFMNIIVLALKFNDNNYL